MKNVANNPAIFASKLSNTNIIEYDPAAQQNNAHDIATTYDMFLIICRQHPTHV